MRRIFALALAFLFLILGTSCDDSTVIENESEAPLETSESVAGNTYVLNINTKKYHIESCRYAIDMSEENKKVTSDIDFIVERGYTPCSSCIMR